MNQPAVPGKDRVKQFFDHLAAETAVDIITITPQPGAVLERTGSNFGGLFYLPRECSIPCTEAGGQMYMLAQINCAELPANNIYPDTGIMQFWIDGSDDVMGMDFEDILSDAGKRVIYHPEITDHLSAEELSAIYRPQKADDGELYTPIFEGAPLAMVFTPGKQSIRVTDFRFDAVFTEKWNEFFPDCPLDNLWELNDIDEELFDAANEKFWGQEQCQIGGYGSFTQEDPRFEDPLDDYTELLLQIETVNGPGYEMMWGDLGVGGFFARPQQLADLDFANCIFNWDCG
ncbi:YwqG family protein [Corynebacterium mendelii]|uniref:DUF1963 domain-containing protein n=1 Tax=Corynebacterium mendelii TaxID=2765362 RepID=A0A939E3G4_9CORY|nr:DUF1963 domain-containing protein [Corynebacterium mendelii]MBN9644877.1 DUF1963 domain-containing protein [Corynebacterium mendelii]